MEIRQKNVASLFLSICYYLSNIVSILKMNVSLSGLFSYFKLENTGERIDKISKHLPL
jgi:hypothetical protein